MRCVVGTTLVTPADIQAARQSLQKETLALKCVECDVEVTCFCCNSRLVEGSMRAVCKKCEKSFCEECHVSVEQSVRICPGCIAVDCTEGVAA